MSDLNKIKEMSLAELKELQARVEKEIPEKAKRAAREAAAEVRRILHALDVSWDTLVAELSKKPAPAKKKATRKKRAKKKAVAKVAPKYRNPADASQTWAGRGRKPKWLETELAAGKKIEDFAIKD